jgi:hypothetical protein
MEENTIPEYGKIEGFDNWKIDIIDTIFNLNTIIYFSYEIDGTITNVNPFTEWVILYDEQTSNQCILFGYDFPTAGITIPLQIWFTTDGIEELVFDGTLDI